MSDDTNSDSTNDATSAPSSTSPSVIVAGTALCGWIAWLVHADPRYTFGVLVLWVIGVTGHALPGVLNLLPKAAKAPAKPVRPTSPASSSPANVAHPSDPPANGPNPHT